VEEDTSTYMLIPQKRRSEQTTQGDRPHRQRGCRRARGEVKNSLSYVKATSASFDQMNF
jgi:hypothetical protein